MGRANDHRAVEPRDVCLVAPRSRTIAVAALLLSLSLSTPHASMGEGTPPPPLVNPLHGRSQEQAPAPQAVASRLGEAYRLGSGEPVLLLIPCASCRWRSFDEFMQRNAERYTMYAVTLPGYGGTRPPDLPRYSTSTLWHNNAVAALIDLLESQDVRQAITPAGYQRVFLYETPHFVMEERPELFDRMIADFVAGRSLEDFRPGSR